MTRRAVIVAAVLATGCDSVLGLREFPPATADAAPIPISCDTRQIVPLCADFEQDGPGPLVYTDGTPSVWSLTGTGVTATVDHPGYAGSVGDLAIATTGGTFFKTFSPTNAATVVKASFDFIVKHESTVPLDTGLMRIAFEGSGHNSCYANFVIDESVPTLRVNGSCGTDSHSEIAVPFGWVHVDFTFDLTGDVTATLKINNSLAQATFFVPPLANLKYSVQIGIDGATLDGLTVGYDNILVTSN